MSEKNEWKPIDSAPKDELILVGPTKRMGICVAMNHSRDGWVTETCNEWFSIYTPTHWMPLPAEPCLTCNGHGMVGGLTPHSGYDAEPCPGCTPAPSAPGDAQDGVTMLPDGSAFALASFPLPASHWLYAEREYAPGAEEPKELPAPILTHTQRDAVVAAVRYAVRGATMCGKEQDFDPDALVQNAVYALCGPYGSAAPAAGDALDSKRLKWIAQNAWALRDLDNGRKNSLVWQQPRTSTEGALDRLRAAVDAALAAQVPQQGEA